MAEATWTRPMITAWRAATGDAAALGREALAYADTLYNLARYLTRSPTDAEDLVQETYARALTAAHQFTPGTQSQGLALPHPAQHVPQPVPPRAAQPDRGRPRHGRADLAGRGAAQWLRGDVELDRLRKVVGEEIERALMSLAEEARTVILLDLEGLTEVEVAAGRGLPGRDREVPAVAGPRGAARAAPGLRAMTCDEARGQLLDAQRGRLAPEARAALRDAHCRRARRARTRRRRRRS